MAMFWWGKAPKTEIRQHKQFYSACNAKCKPLLTWMLKGMNVAVNALENRNRTKYKTLFTKTTIWR